jgi:hypothetical protein
MTMKTIASQVKRPSCCQKTVLVLVLQGVEEHAVPLVEQHQHVHRAQVERDDAASRPRAFQRSSDLK